MDTPELNIIDKWQSYLTNISSNLMELSDQTEYQLIKAKAADSNNGYTGITKQKAQGCVDSVGALWRYFALLSEVIEKAVSLNSKQSFLYNAQEDIRELLEKTLIVIDTKHVQINERNLLENRNDERKATPTELLKFMQESFENVGKDIKEIISAQEAIGTRLLNIKNEIKRLDSTSRRLNLNNVPEFNTQSQMELERDPLKGMMEIDKLVYNIEKYRASIRQVEEDYKNTLGRLVSIKEMLSELNRIALKSREALIESQKVFGHSKDTKPVIGEDVIKSLEDWLCVLENKLTEGSLKAVKIGLLKLEQECQIKLQREQENYSFNSKEYNEWLDLKGQFEALVIKSKVLRTRGLLIDNSLDKLIEAAKAALYEPPVNLYNCRQLVSKFGSSL